MKFPYEFQIGWRYTCTSKRSSSNGFISFISFISMAGIALGVAALIVVLSVMNGFQKEVRDRMLSVLAHIEVFAQDGNLSEWRRTAGEALQNKEILAAAPYVGEQAMLTRDDRVCGVVLRGIMPIEEAKVSDLDKHVTKGNLTNLTPGSFGVALGCELARGLDVHVGEKITLVVPQKSTVTPAGILPRVRQFTVVAIFTAGHYEYDSSLALIDLEDAQKFFRLTGPTGIRLKVKDMDRAPLVARDLAKVLSGDMWIRDWTQQNKNWFVAVQTEKRIMFIILMLIIAVATFNLVSSLVMTVTDKYGDIAILRTLGAQPSSIVKIFIVQGVTIGFIGTFLGIALGCVISLNISTIVPFIEQLFGIHFLPKDIYFISELPSDLHMLDITRIGLISFILALLATIYPSWRAAQIKPAEVLRYE
ncbi:lipoprotein-releasing ABC transporter permease subunit [Candidatus Pandoraea novymonadis]|uniref:Lipoprotein-releasing system transmembrane protein LolE n=1 Tax=Candidatus Pandoraea novymonadis TaxID=1808959 RepID=A0ABX5FEU3_9BURK|nr:lipoprotein-releasing ABC transporter permease subunit [Candidatus Pandoraea novymonadis]PSB92220.1 Lipoprotein-releasing system transmembrane protein LolE [Candidatus Pandoraea novymonadis]